VHSVVNCCPIHRRLQSRKYSSLEVCSKVSYEVHALGKLWSTACLPGDLRNASLPKLTQAPICFLLFVLNSFAQFSHLCLKLLVFSLDRASKSVPLLAPHVAGKEVANTPQTHFLPLPELALCTPVALPLCCFSARSANLMLGPASYICGSVSSCGH